MVTGDVFEVRRYKRLTNLRVLNRGIGGWVVEGIGGWVLDGEGRWVLDGEGRWVLEGIDG